MVTKAASQIGRTSPLSKRESEFLKITLWLLQQHGYGGLTVGDVATIAKASKATVYRRWPSKAELVLAAVTEAFGPIVAPPDTGTLRGDLLRIGQLVRKQARTHAPIIRAILIELPRNPALQDLLQRQFLDQRKMLLEDIVRRAVERGEIDATAISNELLDLLPGYLIFRSIMSSRPLTQSTVQTLVDHILVPSLTRTTNNAALAARPTVR